MDTESCLISSAGESHGASCIFANIHFAIVSFVAGVFVFSVS